MSNSNRKAALGIIGGKGMPPLGLLLALAAMAHESEAEKGHAKAFGNASPFNKSGSDDQAEAFADAMMEVLFGEGCGECEGCKNRAKANAEAGTNNKPVISGKKLAKGLLQVAPLFYSYQEQLQQGKTDGSIFPEDEKAQVYEAISALHNHLEHIKTLVKEA